MSGFQFSLDPVNVPKIHTEFREIKTPIPVPDSLPLLADLEKYESVSMHGQMPVVWDRAEGFQVYDAWGNKWLDFTSTIFVANAGHGNPRIVQALRKVLEKPLLHTYTYCSKERADYIKYLIEQTPPCFEKAFLLSAGTEATECALKLMRMNAFRQGKKRPGIITFEGNWHGRTLGAQMMSSNMQQKSWIGYLDPNIHELPFPYPWREKAVKDPVKYFRENMEALLAQNSLNPDTDLCGILMETFQGWGALFYPTEFVKAVKAFAVEHGLLLAFDEMQAGFGRTGRLFGYMHYDIEPDIICCGKGAGSSLPLSIVLGSREIMDLPDIGSMSSTHSANPLVCAAGKANLEAMLEDGLVENSEKLGRIFIAQLKQIKEQFPNHISYVSGRGLLAAVHFNDPQGNPLSSLCNHICEAAMRRGLLVVHTGRESIKLAPPLMITEEALMEGLQVLAETISDCIEEMKA